ncbi:MAG TPA: hypothetical protein VMT59_16925 [Gaiellaceae bacterium]|nr:hypothetical protein [Gaiellaceae bacterium]
MTRARRHRRISAAFAFGLLAFVAELVGRSLTHRLDVGRHVATPGYATADYYPVLLAVVKVTCALAVAAVGWRLTCALIAARAARLRLGAGRAPRLRLELSSRLWLISFWVTSMIYLLQTDAERVAGGQWPLLAPWLHSSALPIFSLLAIVVALVFGAVTRWLSELDRFVETAHAAVRLSSGRDPQFHPTSVLAPPRRLFGLSLQSRPPPAPA